MTDQIESLFLNTLNDLERRISAQDPYEILGASALIRKLIVDSDPLVDQLNRRYRVKLKFEVADPLGLPPGIAAPQFFTVQDGIDPDTARPGKNRKQVSRDQLFNTILTIVDGHHYTLREIVLFEANVMGGVHAGSAKEDKEHALQLINNTISVGGYRSSLRQLQGIGRVILKALAPLKDLVKSAPHSQVK